MLDLVIRNGRLVDGSGEEPRVADVGIAGDRVVEVGRRVGVAQREIDADGLLVTPGFVDPHTHYDGQLLWDPVLTPSANHGVTSVVAGNCGVGFAPARAADRDWLISLMAGVEDVPAPALSEGLPWTWEHFPEYLDRIDATPRAVDVGMLVPHGPVRAYTMGARSILAEEPAAEELATMATLVRRALDAGALGFSTSRTSLHLSLEGEPAPGTFASWQELRAMAAELQRAGGRVFQLALPNSFEDPTVIDRDLAEMATISAELGVPFSFNWALNHADPDHWQKLFAVALASRERGARLQPMVLPRPHTVLVGHRGVNPFARKPSYAALEALDFAARIERLRDSHLRSRILAEEPLPPDPADPYADIYDFDLEHLYPLGDPPDYAPGRERSVQALAEQAHRSPMELLYDLMLEEDGEAFLLYVVMNYPERDLGPVRDMITHPCAVLGLSDAGAHCGSVCDGGATTFLLSHWGRDRDEAGRLPLPWLVQQLTAKPAALFGLPERGLLRPGYRADLNVIDFEGLESCAPEMVHDLPTGAPRLTQGARGYRFTLLAGVPVREDDEDTGARPGRLVRA